MNAVTKIKPPVEGDPLLTGIIRAAESPQTDVEKLERLMALYERRAADNAHRAFIAALADCQSELPIIGKRGSVDLGRGGKGYSYATWDDINEQIKPILHRHGFALNFKINSTDKTVTVTGTLRHREGHSDETTMTLPFDTSGAKNGVQAMGSSSSYGKRYIANALLNLTSRDGIEADDDGRQAVGYEGGPKVIAPADLAHLEHLLSEPGAPSTKIFCRFFKIDKPADLPASKWDEAVTEIAHYKAQRKGAA